MVCHAFSYDCACWSFATQAKIAILEILQNKIFRLIAGVTCFVRNKYIRNNLNIPVVREMAEEVRIRAAVSDNCIVRQIFECLNPAPMGATVASGDETSQILFPPQQLNLFI